MFELEPLSSIDCTINFELLVGVVRLSLCVCVFEGVCACVFECVGGWLLLRVYVYACVWTTNLPHNLIMYFVVVYASSAELDGCHIYDNNSNLGGLLQVVEARKKIDPLHIINFLLSWQLHTVYKLQNMNLTIPGLLKMWFVRNPFQGGTLV